MTKNIHMHFLCSVSPLRDETPGSNSNPSSSLFKHHIELTVEDVAAKTADCSNAERVDGVPVTLSSPVQGSELRGYPTSFPWWAPILLCLEGI